ncbi:hypothetical protein EDD15DRAFT_2359427 [Pisolithus albus]|nr:hypothetical protein EDD15DRAFT_2359427 [Pisolithus albus]
MLQLVVKKYGLLHTGNSISLSPESKHTLEEEALEEVEEASSKLHAAHAALWKVYKGTIGIQETFTRVTDASARLDTICNKLTVLTLQALHNFSWKNMVKKLKEEILFFYQDY